MIRRSATALLLLALPLLYTLPAVADDELESVRLACAEKLARELDELAFFCHENKLYLGRDNCYRMLLRFMPDHKDARKRLKYRKTAGEWVQGKYSPPKNRNDEMEPIYLEQVRKIVRTYIDTLIAILKKTDTGWETPERNLALADVIHVEPDNEEARAMMGEARLRGKWVLVETVNATNRHEDLKAAAKEALEAVKPPARIQTTDEERKLGVKWNASLKGEWWRAVGTVGEKEVRNCLKYMDASDMIFNQIFGLEFKRPKGCGFYLLSGGRQAKTVLTNHPAFGDAQTTYLLGLTAGWIPGKRIFFKWSDNEPMRLDGSVRNAVGILMLKTFGISTKRGWVWEGLGLYIDEIITGQHRTVFVTRKIHTTTEREAKFDIERRMKAPGSDWLLIARELFDANLAPNLEVMARKETNDLVNEDLVVGYALARYIVEGHPEKATPFFLFHGETQPIYETISTIFKRPIPSFEARFRRWLKEIN